MARTMKTTKTKYNEPLWICGELSNDLLYIFGVEKASNVVMAQI